MLLFWSILVFLAWLLKAQEVAICDKLSGVSFNIYIIILDN